MCGNVLTSNHLQKVCYILKSIYEYLGRDLYNKKRKLPSVAVIQDGVSGILPLVGEFA